MKEENKESIRKIKHEFMVFRNGIVADALRKSGIPFDYIFGLQLPQISSIAKEKGQNYELALELWNDSNVRESRLLAIYLFPASQISIKEAIKLMDSVKTREEAEILSFRLLRNTPFSQELLETMKKEDHEQSPLTKYCVKMLERNLNTIIS